MGEEEEKKVQQGRRAGVRQRGGRIKANILEHLICSSRTPPLKKLFILNGTRRFEPLLSSLSPVYKEHPQHQQMVWMELKHYNKSFIAD